MKRVLFIFIIALIFVVPVITSAQVIPVGIDEDVEFILSPTTPEPNDTVNARINSYVSDLDAATISWYIDGTLFDSGVGLRSIDFRVGDSGDVTNLRIVIQKSDGGTLEETYSISPAGIGLIYEAETYVPPFYKGKALASPQSTIKFIAIPNFVDSAGNKISSSNITYTWEIDGTVDQANSGNGRDTYTYTSDILSRPVEVLLRAEPIGSDQQAKEVKVFEFTNPKLLFYGNSPVYGTVLESALANSVMLVGQEVSVTAAPFFFSLDDLAVTDFEWKVNSEDIDQNDETLSFRRVDENSGETRIGLTLDSPNSILQEVSSSFRIYFEEGQDFEF